MSSQRSTQTQPSLSTPSVSIISHRNKFPANSNDARHETFKPTKITPLGLFNSKNFGTTISPWVITLDALEPYKVSAPPRERPVPSCLHDPQNEIYRIALSAEIRAQGSEPYTTACTSKMEIMYWSFWHMLAHHTIAGCNLRAGDIIASGTVSSVGQEERGCLVESTWGGRKVLSLVDGSTRAFLQDGDEVRLSGCAGADGKSGVGFGECTGRLLPARPVE